ncbi:hypothetical protein GEMRC1_003685 [Eukaryota sp. GEM-RC1]
MESSIVSRLLTVIQSLGLSADHRVTQDVATQISSIHSTLSNITDSEIANVVLAVSRYLRQSKDFDGDTVSHVINQISLLSQDVSSLSQLESLYEFGSNQWIQHTLKAEPQVTELDQGYDSISTNIQENGHKIDELIVLNKKLTDIIRTLDNEQ